eukprot:TRINITY_DN818_c0_g2_i1.p1 TRINITY_DN818_c0_g2~~TRINITY_DN818_c0_g2_i1.p1  ORF type:complete len:427 (-),score=151.34 TRINITY_DN818_c0_g2_i1:291-1571(-)
MISPSLSSHRIMDSGVIKSGLKMTNFSIDAIMKVDKEPKDESLSLKSEVDLGDVEEELDVVETSEEDDVSISKKQPKKKEKMTSKFNTEEMRYVTCTLETKELWDKFHDLETEMIITKTGRRMFPTVRASFQNIRSDRKYWVILDIVPCDNKRYRYAYHRSSWLVAGKADPPPPKRFYIHPDSPFTGDQLRKQVVSFEKVKLTNNEMDKNGQIILNSMHRFQPRVHLVSRPSFMDQGPISCIERESHHTWIYPETVFTAVTAYQNQLITKLKIDSNPFAKGFRDSSRLNDYETELYGFPPPPHMGGLHPAMFLDSSLLLRSPFMTQSVGEQSDNAKNNNGHSMLAAAEKARTMMMMAAAAAAGRPHQMIDPLSAVLGQQQQQGRLAWGNPTRFSPYVLPPKRSPSPPKMSSNESPPPPLSATPPKS